MRSPLPKPRAFLLALPLAVSLLSGGCISHAVHVEPITLAPIQMTVDVNVHSDREDEEETTGGDDEATPETPTRTPMPE